MSEQDFAQKADKNPIERRLDQLTAHWKEFVQNSNARLLRWVVDREDANMMDTFFEVQNEEGGSELTDLFVKLEAPFEPTGDDYVNEYNIVQKQEFEKMYDEIKQSLAKDGVDNSWKVPKDSNGAMLSLVECYKSFQHHYKEIVNHLVLVLVPSAITDKERWNDWLQFMLQQNLPEEVRLTTVDYSDELVLDQLAARNDSAVVTVRPNLDMAEAMKEIASTAGSGPGADFRRLFVDMAMSKSQDAASLQGKADAALQIAKANNWLSLQVAVYLLLGATHFKDGRNSEALASYEAAKQLSQTADPKVDPAGTKLAVQSSFGKAAVLFSSGQYGEAAKAYEEAADAAKSGQDHHMTMDALRMASYCYQQDKKIDEAWTTGWAALEASEKIEKDTRQSGGTTLPFLGQALLGIARSEPKYEDKVDAITTRMNELAGPDWREQAASAGGA